MERILSRQHCPVGAVGPSEHVPAPAALWCAGLVVLVLVGLLTLRGSGVSQVTCGIVLSYWLGVRFESLCVGA